MKRWKLPLATVSIAAYALLACLAGLFPSEAGAQVVQRTIPVPKDVKRGVLIVTLPPEATLNGLPDRLSPGVRIRSTNNMLLLSGTIAGQALPVLYRRDTSGLIHEAWVLTPAEDSQLRAAEGSNLFYELLVLIFGVR
jgi:hypothetical protein